MIHKGRATFVGADGIMGFEHGRGYKVKIKNRSGFARLLRFPEDIILRTFDGLQCTYESIEELLKDWELDHATNK